MFADRLVNSIIWLDFYSKKAIKKSEHTFDYSKINGWAFIKSAKKPRTSDNEQEGQTWWDPTCWVGMTCLIKTGYSALTDVGLVRTDPTSRENRLHTVIPYVAVASEKVFTKLGLSSAQKNQILRSGEVRGQPDWYRYGVLSSSWVYISEPRVI